MIRSLPRGKRGQPSIVREIWNHYRLVKIRIKDLQIATWLMITALLKFPPFFLTIDRPFASSSHAKSAGEIVGGVLGSVLLLVVAYVVVKKRRRRRNTHVFTDMLDLAYKLQKEEKELEEPEQEEHSTTTQLQFSFSPYWDRMGFTSLNLGRSGSLEATYSGFALAHSFVLERVPSCERLGPSEDQAIFWQACLFFSSSLSWILLSFYYKV